MAAYKFAKNFSSDAKECTSQFNDISFEIYLKAVKDFESLA